MKTIKRVFFIALFNAVAMVAILFGFEFLFNPYADLPADGRVAGDLYTWGHLVELNKYGFRERNFRTPKPAGVYRILVLGDSLTWGVGLAVEERYTAIAESLLKEAFDDREFEILNLGITGASTILERDILQRFREAMDPDLIVVGFCLNDPQPRLQHHSVEREELGRSLVGRTVDVSQWLLRNNGLPYVGTLLNDSFYRLAEFSGSIPSWQEALERTYEPQSEEWRDFIQALKEIKDMSDELGLPAPIFAILNQGTYRDKPTDYANPDEHLEQFLRWYHQAEDAARNVGYMTYDHENEIARQLSDEPLAVNVLDGHPSANLNRIYGEKLYRKIAEHVSRDSEGLTAPP